MAFDGGMYGMMMMHTSRRTDISTAGYCLQTEQKLHHCVMDVRQQYPIAPLFRGNLAHAQTMCTRLSLRNPQNVAEVSLGTMLASHSTHLF